MRDKRPVDELSIEELERILAIRKREARQARLRRFENDGRIVAPVPEAPSAPREEEAKEVKAEPSPAPVERPAVPPRAKTPPPEYFMDDPEFEDDLAARKTRKEQYASDAKNPMVIAWNRVMMLVELAAVAGLIYLVVGLLQTLQAATQASAEIQAQYQATASAKLIPPTATPVINIRQVVLPVGHTVKVNEKGIVSASFNLDEVPAQYREQYRVQLLDQPPIPPTPSPEGPIRIQIPKIKVDSTVVAGDDWNTLQLGVGHHIGSANPGQRGNMVLSGHNDVYGEIFRDLEKLQPGDLVRVSTTSKEYVYVVQESRIVNPTDVWVMESRGDTRQLTLITCHPYRVDTKRLIVFATLAS